jgi:CRISPR/Cas system-associated protein Csx1
MLKQVFKIKKKNFKIMKKLFLSVLFSMLSVALFSQTFVNKYTSVIGEKAGVLGKWETTSTTVVFNEKDTGDIVFYYSNGNIKRFHQVGDVTKDKTKSGEEYQIIICIDDEDGKKIALQLFTEDSTLRILISDGYYAEFHK